MKVVLHGVRGSSPASGAEFLQVGGATSCVAVTLAGSTAPTLLLDAGTGLWSVAAALAGAPYRGSVLLTHLHWDHVQGLPFFRAGDHEDAEVQLLLPAQDGATPDRPGSALALLARGMSPPHFPIGPDELNGHWTFDAVEPGTFAAGGCEITALEVPHRGGRTFGYRVEADGVSIAYLPDHSPVANREPGLELARGVDVLLHGAMFAESERARARAYGHSTVRDGWELARDAGARQLVLIHHAPERTDDQIEALAAEFRDAEPPVRVGRHGDVVLDAGRR